MSITQITDDFLAALVALLPRSPFRALMDEFNGTLGGYGVLPYLNYFLPITEMVAIMQLWVTCIGLYYLYSVVMRWVKLIGD